MRKIIFGSEDSLDIDVVYIFDEMPSLNDCKKFCSDKIENRNIVCIEEGIVSKSFKGTTDEMNNVIFNTFKLHKQELNENPIKRIVVRNKEIKTIRTIRGILSELSRTDYREIIKKTLKSYLWLDRINCLKEIDIDKIVDYEKTTRTEFFKFLAFQLGQTIGLFEGKELYTKKTVSEEYPKLKKYLYREENTDSKDLIDFFNYFIVILESEIKYKQVDNTVIFFDHKSFSIKEFDIRTETQLFTKNINVNS